MSALQSSPTLTDTCDSMGDRAKTMSSSSSEQPGIRSWGSLGKEMGHPSLPGISSHSSKDTEILIKAAPQCLASTSP